MWFRVHEDHVAAAQDAIGDILIYMADYCSRRGFEAWVSALPGFEDGPEYARTAILFYENEEADEEDDVIITR